MKHLVKIYISEDILVRISTNENAVIVLIKKYNAKMPFVRRS
jgi:hypothetical protein